MSPDELPTAIDHRPTSAPDGPTFLMQVELVDVLSHLAPPSGSGAAEVLQLTAHDFYEVAKRQPLLLATFMTRWCARCAELARPPSYPLLPPSYRRPPNPLPFVRPSTLYAHTPAPVRRFRTRVCTGVRNFPSSCRVLPACSGGCSLPSLSCWRLSTSLSRPLPSGPSTQNPSAPSLWGKSTTSASTSAPVRACSPPLHGLTT